MLETIKSIILDQQEAPLKTGVPRRLDIEPVPGKATVCIGVRRSGKSTYLFQVMDRLLRGGVPRENILYLNFFDDRLHGLDASSIALVIEAYFGLYPRKKGAETVHCFLDEIQAVPGWEPFVDRVMRTENCEVWLTGSSARMLSKEIATQMRGRALSWEVFPFSFREFLDARGLDAAGSLSTKRRLLVEQAFDEHWDVGGFPEVAAQPAAGGSCQAMPARLRVKTHQEYLQAILFRDLVERHDIAHPKALSDMVHRLLDNVASMTTVNSLLGHLKALGHRLSKDAVSQYLEWLEDAYFLFTVPVFDASLARRNTNPKKVYCIDHALVASTSSGILVNSGHLLENIVHAALRRGHGQVHYYKTKSGKEVDFIVAPRGGERRLVQVCESLADPRTREREVSALREAMAEQGLSRGLVVTRREEKHRGLGDGIAAVPAWRFLLDDTGEG